MGAALTSLLPDYVIYIQTGDVKGGGTDAAVHLRLYNDQGRRSREIHLTDPFGWNFERNQTDKFYIRDLGNFGEIVKIEIWRDVWFGDDWYVDSVIVEDFRRKDRFPFPVHRWVTDDLVFIHKYDCILPMDEPNPQQRSDELAFNKRQYNFGPSEQGIPIMVERLPKHEEFSFSHQMDLNKQLMHSILTTKVNFMMSPPWTTLDSITNVYSKYFVLPECYPTWREDLHFGSQRLQGCNPCAIRLCTEVPPNLAVTNAMVKPIMEGMTLQECMAQKRLFVIDYSMLKDIPKTFETLVVCAPIALFFMNKDKALMPVAIQLFQDPGPDNPVFLPTDPEYTWLLAKMFFNNADASVHESAVHLAFSHLLVESFSMAVNRNLSPSHPIYRLLAPHLKYVMAINHSAVETLISPNGWVDKAMSVGRVGMLEIIRREWKNWRFDVDGDLPSSLKARGVDDPGVIPEFPFRDDAILLYNAVKNYVASIVKGHYETCEKVAEDNELQNMAREISAPPPEGLGVKGVPGNGSFRSKDDLIVVLTWIIFNCTVGHSATNYAQYNEYAFPPNYPSYLRGKPPTSKAPLTEDDVMERIPVKEMMLNIMAMTYCLSAPSNDTLKRSAVITQYDPIGANAYQDFQEELEGVGRIIDERNEKRKRKYPYLHPDRVANSINI